MDPMIIATPGIDIEACAPQVDVRRGVLLGAVLDVSWLDVHHTGIP